MRRQIRRPERMSWSNPIRMNMRIRPYLGEMRWPSEPGTPSADEAYALLCRFYVNARRTDLDEDRRPGERERDYYQDFRAYVASPDNPILVIWGAPGVGKTWFLRHEMKAIAESTRGCFTGVVDLLDTPGSVVESAVLRQMCPLLDMYFKKFFGSTDNAMKECARLHVERRTGVMSEAPGMSDAYAAALAESLAGLRPAQEYFEVLMAALEALAGPTLFVGIDNIDRTPDATQAWLLEFCNGILRNYRIRLVIPLRRTPSLFQDRFSGLHQMRYSEMNLPPLDLKEVIRLRFQMGSDGSSLDSVEIKDGDRSFTYPGLFQLMKEGTTLEFVQTFSGGNAREALMMTERTLLSDQLKGLGNIGDAEHAVAALMLEDSADFDATYPHIVNLFDSNEPGEPKGYGLIRFRVLEHLVRNPSVDPADTYFRKYFERLGYSRDRVKAVLVTFLMTGIVMSDKYLDADMFRARSLSRVGVISLTRAGRRYYDYLIKKLWYWVGVKRGTRFPQRTIQSEGGIYDTDDAVEYVTNTDLVNWLSEQEQTEGVDINRWEEKNGPLPDATLTRPSFYARQALRGRAPPGKRRQKP